MNSDIAGGRLPRPRPITLPPVYGTPAVPKIISSDNGTAVTAQVLTLSSENPSPPAPVRQSARNGGLTKTCEKPSPTNHAEYLETGHIGTVEKKGITLETCELDIEASSTKSVSPLRKSASSVRSLVTCSSHVTSPTKQRTIKENTRSADDVFRSSTEMGSEKVFSERPTTGSTISSMEDLIGSSLASQIDSRNSMMHMNIAHAKNAHWVDVPENHVSHRYAVTEKWKNDNEVPGAADSWDMEDIKTCGKNKRHEMVIEREEQPMRVLPSRRVWGHRMQILLWVLLGAGIGFILGMLSSIIAVKATEPGASFTIPVRHFCIPTLAGITYAKERIQGEPFPNTFITLRTRLGTVAQQVLGLSVFDDSEETCHIEIQTVSSNIEVLAQTKTIVFTRYNGEQEILDWDKSE